VNTAPPALRGSTGAGPELPRRSTCRFRRRIGQAEPEIVPSLIVINAHGASLQGGQLTLAGVAPNSIVFADRPVRAAGLSLTTDLLEEWSPSNDSDGSFAKDPPNATVSTFGKDGSKIRDAVVVLKTAKLEGDRLTFDVDVLEGEPAGGDGPAALFIDRFGLGGFHGGGDFRGGFAHVGTVGVGRVGAVGAWHHPAASFSTGLTTATLLACAMISGRRYSWSRERMVSMSGPSH
jgi:hypothetical protein